MKRRRRNPKLSALPASVAASIKSWLRYHNGNADAVAREIHKQTGLSVSDSLELVKEATKTESRNPRRRRAARRNPTLPAGRPQIYERVLAVQAQKADDPNTVWTHRFPRRLPASSIVGLPNGDVLIKSNGQPLWGDV